jgi:four helix bundle protein
LSEHRLPFEKLHVWHLAKDFAKQVYCLTCDFPAAERYGLTSQINRAAVSVMSNLAEGSARTSRKDQAHFSQMSYSSLMEVACQLQLAQELDFFSVERYTEFRMIILELAAKINALRRSQIGNREQT